MHHCKQQVNVHSFIQIVCYSFSITAFNFFYKRKKTIHNYKLMETHNKKISIHKQQIHKAENEVGRTDYIFAPQWITILTWIRLQCSGNHLTTFAAQKVEQFCNILIFFIVPSILTVCGSIVPKFFLFFFGWVFLVNTITQKSLNLALLNFTRTVNVP